MENGGEESGREGCTCRTRFLSDDKEQSKEEGEEEDRRRFPARGHRTIIFPCLAEISHFFQV